MSDTKFTKGKWELALDMGGRTLIHCEDTSICDGIDCNHQGNNTYPHNIEAEANANLIKASPKMYKMLESVIGELHVLIDEVNDQRASRINSQTETEPDYHDMETLHNIQVLLAEARGEL